MLMSHSSNNQSNGKHPVEQDSTVIGKRYQLIREINVPSSDRLKESLDCKTYLAQDAGIIGHPFCVVKKILLAQDDETNLDLNKAKWDELVAIQQQLGKYPEIPRILAYFVEKSYLYIIREYLEGKTLAQQISDRLLTQTETLKVFLDILDVLAFVQSNNLIYGNIQPKNIIQLKSNGKYTLIDFDNIQKITLDEEHLLDNKIDTLLVNTNSFFAPEQSAGQPILSSDFYSLGKTLIYSLTKSLSPQWQEELNNKAIVNLLDPKLKQILDRTIVPNVKARYHSTREIIEELAQIEDVSTIMNSYSSSLASSNPQITNFKDSSTAKHNRKTTTTSEPKKSKFETVLGIIFSLFVFILLAELFHPVLRPFYYFERGKRVLTEKPELALDRFQKAIELNSEHHNAWLGRGDALFNLERYRSALLAYDKATELNPNNARSWKKRGDTLFRLERFEAALTVYNKSLQIQPRNAEGLNRKGRALYKLERLESALVAQEAALEVQPNYARALSDRGIVLIGLGQYEEALKSLEDAQAIEPLNPEFWQNKALAWQYLGRNQEAFRLYQEALESYNNKLEKDPKNVTALIDKGNVLTKLKQHSEAIRAYNRAIAINPNSHLALLNKGNAFFALGRYDEALKTFDRALKIAPESYITWHNRGSLLRDGQQNFTEAIASYQQATELNPNFYPAWRDLGLAQSQSGQQFLALKSFQTALEIKPEDYQSWVGTGIAFSSLNKIDNSVAAFDRAGELNPNDPFVWMNKGYALEGVERYREACDAYQKVAQIDPAFAPANEAMARLNCQR
jgi:eukaryotic-like serine/threonine-protein kinase